MKLNRFISKREFAFRASFEGVWESAPRCYFWTFTPICPMSDAQFAAAWNRFNTRWKDWGRTESFRGLRVFEPFQSGFLHCHAIINEYLRVEAMRQVAAGTGIGRLHARLAHSGDGEYLCKYMAKSRWKLPNGMRMWAKLGNWQHTAVKNVVIQNSDSDRFRYFYDVVNHDVKPQSRRFLLTQWMALNAKRAELCASE